MSERRGGSGSERGRAILGRSVATERGVLFRCFLWWSREKVCGRLPLATERRGARSGRSFGHLCPCVIHVSLASWLHMGHCADVLLSHLSTHSTWKR